MPPRAELSKGELYVIRAVWDLDEATVGQIHEWFPKKQKVEYTTVQTYLRRLEAKGYLTTKRLGRYKLYRPKVEKRQVIQETVGHLISRLFDGDALPLMMHLIEDQGISPEDVASLKKALANLEGDRK